MTAPAYDPNQHIQIVTKRGGLTGAAHAVHILICFFTCGLWIPGYLIFIAKAPAQRFEAVAPAGADPQVIARARMVAEQNSNLPPRVVAVGPSQHLPSQPATARQIKVRFIIVGGIIAFFGAWALFIFLIEQV